MKTPKIYISIMLFIFISSSVRSQSVGDVVINEFIVSPSSTNGKEYIEILILKDNIDLSGWTISDCNSRVTLGSTQEGDITLPSNANYLKNLKRGTYLVVELSVPVANLSEMPEDTLFTDDTPRRIVIKPETNGVVLNQTMDLISSSENIQLYAGSRATGTIIDQVLIGTSTSLISNSATWGDNNSVTTTDNLQGITNRSYSFIPSNSESEITFSENNDTSRFFISLKSKYKTPGFVNVKVEDIVLSGLDTVGSIHNLLKTVFWNIPDSVTNAFVVPNIQELADFQEAFLNIASHNYNAVPSLINQYGYHFYKFDHLTTGESGTFYILRENVPVARGWGTYIFHPSARNDMTIESPHPIWDNDSWIVASKAFIKLDAEWFFMAGTHRYANEYMLVNDTIPSDMAHVTQSVFHTGHKTIGSEKVLQIHGFAKTGIKVNYPDVVISNGSSQPNDILFVQKTNTIAEGFTAGLYRSGDPDEVGSLGATQNEQGKWSRPNGKLFVHIESDTPLRSVEENRNKLVNTFYVTYPPPPIDTPLPISLTEILHYWQKNNLILKWKTISEINHAGFYVKRNGKIIADYKKMQSLNGSGNTAVEKIYTVIDKDLSDFNESINYEIISVSIDGSEKTYKYKVEANTSFANFQLYNVYPNPFNPKTVISFNLPSESETDLTLFNVMGQKVESLINRKLAAGFHEYEFDGIKLPSGIYFVFLKAGNYASTKKIILMK